MERQSMSMADPILGSGLGYTAIGRFPITPEGIQCTAELWLSKDGTSKNATSGTIVFTSTGQIQAINFPVTMPGGGFNYRVFLDIYAGAIPLALFEATELVTVPGVGTPTITW